MELWELDLPWRRCEATDAGAARPGWYGHEPERCGGVALRGVTWQGIEGRHTMLLCDRHTLLWLGEMVKGEGREG